MKNILNYVNFLEAKIADISLFKIDPNNKFGNDIIKKLTYKNLNDTSFIKYLTLKKYYKGKKTQYKLNWYHDTFHDLIKRLDNRTSIKTIDEFNQIFKDTINKILPDYISNGELSSNGRYCIYLHEYNLSLILYINIIKNEITTISIINGFSNEKCLKTFDF